MSIFACFRQAPLNHYPGRSQTLPFFIVTEEHFRTVVVQDSASMKLWHDKYTYWIFLPFVICGRTFLSLYWTTVKVAQAERMRNLAGTDLLFTPHFALCRAPCMLFSLLGIIASFIILLCKRLLLCLASGLRAKITYHVVRFRTRQPLQLIEVRRFGLE